MATMFLGILLGYIFRNIDALQKISKLISYTIYLMLFLLGVSVGANREVVNNLPTLGGQAFIIASAGVLGSAIAAWAIYKFVFKGKVDNSEIVEE